MKRVALCLLCLSLLMACSLRSAPIQTPTGNIPYRLTLHEVRQGIIEGCSQRGWVVTSDENSEIFAEILVRGKHTIKVKIPYSAKKYSIVYQTSINMKYQEKNGMQLIHRNYNNWVLNLKHDIDLILQRMMAKKGI